MSHNSHCQPMDGSIERLRLISENSISTKHGQMCARQRRPKLSSQSLLAHLCLSDTGRRSKQTEAQSSERQKSIKWLKSAILMLIQKADSANRTPFSTANASQPLSRRTIHLTLQHSSLPGLTMATSPSSTPAQAARSPSPTSGERLILSPRVSPTWVFEKVTSSSSSPLTRFSFPSSVSL